MTTNPTPAMSDEVSHDEAFKAVAATADSNPTFGCYGVLHRYITQQRAKDKAQEPSYVDDLELRYVEACEERDHLRKHLTLTPQPSYDPTKWQLVPKRTTEEIRHAICRFIDISSPTLNEIERAYESILQAAPQVQHTEKGND